MAGATSNIDEIERWLTSIADGMRLDARGASGKGLGEEALDAIAEGVFDRTLSGLQPDGSPLKELNEKYRERKIKEGYPELIGVRTGGMLSAVALAGERTFTATEATMTYGDSDRNREVAGYFTEAGRPFYELDEAIEAAVLSVLEDRLDQLLS